jgi:steroid 5-alpha reductase family enzyme
MIPLIGSLWSVIWTDVGIQAAAFAISAPLQTEKFYDISGSLTYASCIAVSLFFRKPHGAAFHLRQKIVSTCAMLWCTRLGLFLGYRVYNHGKDSRFDQVKKDPLRFSVFWGMQAMWIFLTALPVYAVNVLPLARHSPWGLLDTVGLSVWTLGFAFETISDLQKLAWQARLGQEKRSKEFINEGLWALSRHPNYFGEVTLWVGNWIMCASAFRSSGLIGLRAASVLAISPVFVAGLICGLSGIPILEKSSDKKFGHRQDYLEYKKEVPVFFPRLSSKEKST